MLPARARAAKAVCRPGWNISESAAVTWIEPATEVIMAVNPLNPKHLVAMANSGGVSAGTSFLYYFRRGGELAVD